MFRERYRRILWFFGKAILSFIWWDVILFKLGFKNAARKSRPARYLRIAKNFRLEAIRMGGVMIKVGQFLSARLDVLPKEITNELSGLQDEVSPEPFESVRKVIEAEFGSALETKYLEFDEMPKAAASIGQVHLAKLRPEESTDSSTARFPLVAVKVQRPHIEQIVATDLSALKVVASWLMRYPPIRKRVDIPSLLNEFSRSLYEEIDYLHEGKNAEIFAHNFEDDPQIRVPGVVWSHTTRCVLTLEYIEAIKITDYPAIETAGIDRGDVATRLFDTYLKQIFEDNFFHADPHPGNLFVLPEEPQAGLEKRPWKLVFVDFGMAGTVIPNVLEGLREALIALGTRDASRLIKSYKILGVLLPGADTELIERASAKVFEQFWGKSTSEMMNMHPSQAREFIDEFEGLVYEMPFQAPENIVLLVRCVGILSGMCTGLDPDFNLWSSIVPYVKKIITAEDQGGLQYWLGQVGDMVTLLLSLPKKTESLLNRIEQGKIEVRSSEISNRIFRLDRSIRRSQGSIIFAAFLVSSVQTFLAGQIVIAAILGVGAFVSLGWVILTR
jgi:predicted unusual protein kinase regulating ubiquinone biosynthesis (AarF/ABC1/UbiB family)